MNTTPQHLSVPADIDDRALLGRVAQLAVEERVALATLLAHLVLVDERGLYRDAGFASLFDYCRGLGWSESSAYKRMQVTRLCRRMPQVLAVVAEGRLHLTGLSVLAPHLEPENLEEVLSAAAGRTRRELELLVDTLRAAKAPPATSPEKASPLAAQRPLDFNPLAPPEPQPAQASDCVLAPSRPADAGPVTGAGPVRTSIRPPRQASLTIALTPALHALMERARALLSHASGGNDDAAVLEQALALLVEKHEKRRFGAPKRQSRRAKAAIPEPVAGALLPQPAQADSPSPGKAEAQPRKHPGPSEPDGPEVAAAPGAEQPSVPRERRRPRSKRPVIPSRVRREVFERDAGRCTFRGVDGHVCGSRHLLQLHHIIAWAKGGPHTADNLTLHCWSHNALEAERIGLAPARTTRSKRRRSRPAGVPPTRATG